MNIKEQHQNKNGNIPDKNRSLSSISHKPADFDCASTEPNDLLSLKIQNQSLINKINKIQRENEQLKEQNKMDLKVLKVLVEKIIWLPKTYI